MTRTERATRGAFLPRSRPKIRIVARDRNSKDYGGQWERVLRPGLEGRWHGRKSWRGILWGCAGEAHPTWSQIPALKVGVSP